jgi:hypothetical protein
MMSHLPNHEEYGSKTSSDPSVQKEPVNIHDEIYGTYDDAVNKVVNVEDRLPTANMPKAPDPKPFAVK